MIHREDSSYREIRRICSLLVKITRQAGEEEARENPWRTREVCENSAG